MLIRNLCLVAGVALCLPAVARSEADGPDYFAVSGVAPGSVLNFRSGPSVDADRIGRIPADADGLRNLGCEGGMSFGAWQQATDAERAAASRTRWCRVEYDGMTGWVAGWFLAESPAPD